MANNSGFNSLPPSQIVSVLLDTGQYDVSESSFCQILKEHGQQQIRVRSKALENDFLSTHCFTARSKIWCWDINWLTRPAKEFYSYLYLILGLYDRNVVGREVYEKLSSKLALQLIHNVYFHETISRKPLVMHSDSDSLMKGASLMEALYCLDIIEYLSRLLVSNDKTFVESLIPEKESRNLEKLRR